MEGFNDTKKKALFSLTGLFIAFVPSSVMYQDQGFMYQYFYLLKKKRKEMIRSFCSGLALLQVV